MALAAQPTAAPQLRYRILEWARALAMDRLTAPGRALFLILVGVTGVSSITLAVKFYVLFCALAGLVLVSPPLARLARVPLKIRMELPSHATAGIDLRVPVLVTNRARRYPLDVTLHLDRVPPPLDSHPVPLPTLAPGESCRVTFQLKLPRRGYYQIAGVRQATWFPFGLWRDLKGHFQPQTLLVYPSFHPLTALDLPVGRKYQPGGVALSSNLGDSTEFLGVREFRPGDQIRNIHWKSWGRVGAPVVKEFQEEFFCKIAVVLDTFVPADSGERYRDDFEACLSMAAAVADQLAQTEYIIDLFAAGPDLYTLEAGRNLAHLDNVLDVLACLEPSREEPFERVAPVLMEHLSTITTVVLILLDWDPRREALVRLIRDNGPAVKVMLVRREAPSHAPEAAADLVGAVTVLTPEQVKAGVDEL